MSKVNIPKSIIDPFYRYRRDEIKIQVLNNNGGVTKIVNVESICKALNISIKELFSFYKKKLNVATIEKDFIIKKVETINKLEEILEEYIKLNVLCPQCSNPEFIDKDGKKTCKACGFSR